MTPGIRPPSVFAFPHAHYAYTWSLDRSTHGKWLGRYGTLGDALFAFEQHFDPRKYYQPGGVSRHQLAIGICSAQGLCLKDTAWLAPESPVVALRTPIKCGTTLQRRTAGRVARADAPAGRQQQQPQHLQPPPSYLQDPTFWHSGDRALGHAVGGADGSQGLVIDIETAPCSSQCPPFLLSVYFVGADADTQLAVRIMDLLTFTPVARTAHLSDFANGTYLRLHVTGGVRLRVMSLAGFAAASAVFIDPSIDPPHSTAHSTGATRDQVPLPPEKGRASGVLGHLGMGWQQLLRPNAVTRPREFCVTSTDLPGED